MLHLSFTHFVEWLRDSEHFKGIYVDKLDNPLRLEPAVIQGAFIHSVIAAFLRSQQTLFPQSLGSILDQKLNHTTSYVQRLIRSNYEHIQKLLDSYICLAEGYGGAVVEIEASYSAVVLPDVTLQGRLDILVSHGTRGLTIVDIKTDELTFKDAEMPSGAQLYYLALLYYSCTNIIPFEVAYFDLKTNEVVRYDVTLEELQKVLVLFRGWATEIRQVLGGCTDES